MPELPEVEVVRRGLEKHVIGTRIDTLTVHHPRADRKVPGLVAFAEGATITAVRRRGKFLWLELGDGPCIVVHLGMSGQMLIKDNDEQPHRHLRISAQLSSGAQLWFVDQRTFGYWAPSFLEEGVPALAAHIAPDLIALDETERDQVAHRLAGRPTEIKRLLLNQEIVSGIGNIYADEMLWRARIHPRTTNLGHKETSALLCAGQEVMRTALAQGGTSFDELYVNVNGESGYFALHLEAYGQQGKPCSRCGAAIVRESFQNRSSHLCPQCQTAP